MTLMNRHAERNERTITADWHGGSSEACAARTRPYNANGCPGVALEFLLDVKESGEHAAPPRPEVRPRAVRDLGVRRTVIEDLALKMLFRSSPMSVMDLARQTKLSFDVATELFNRMRNGVLCQVTGMRGNIPEIAITGQGRTRAIELLSQSLYVGPAPVALEDYVAQVRRHSVRSIVVHREQVKRAFSHLVIDDRVLWQIGTALNSGSSIFLYGPAGVGKSAIAEALSAAISDDHVWIPWAVEVDGQVIAVYDPVIHKRVHKLEAGTFDERWVLCQRPSVLVGGELTVEMLDLQFNAKTGFYSGPLQMKANNGVLIVDDFGRQRIRPEELLNRWVVPLDRGIDFLTLAGGSKIEIPFEMLVVFATNMNPLDLVDGAFLRRIQTKIRISLASDEQFSEIFRRVARDRGLEICADVLQELIQIIRGELHQELRPCQPRDLVNQVCWAARFEDREPCLDRASVLQAVEAYFLEQI